MFRWVGAGRRFLALLEKIHTPYYIIYISAGYKADGMILATMGAKMVADRMLGQPNAYDRLFDFGKTDTEKIIDFQTQAAE